ncbi:MAG: MgtC/SapB family protein [Lachnospiraceae bacterium]|nr:MgtC/SapB family protein [Lachnospiraceae bacterium]MDD3660822.1 MgtC/SapB family protein [Lachnospiraceae bacterium]
MLERIISTQEFIMTIKLLLALLCGGLLGIEREQKKRPAGFRTYMLVCIGSTLVMITNEFLGIKYPGIDPTRMGAQVISGIGFLGVGTIIVTGDNRVKGLTTAAGLWATACVGLAIGSGAYYAAILVTILIYITMSFLQVLDKRISRNARLINVYIEFEDISDVGKFVRGLRSIGVKIHDMEIKTSKKTMESCTTVLFALGYPQNIKHETALEQLHAMNGVLYAEEI